MLKTERMAKPFLVADLFCGAGGASEAFRRVANQGGLNFEMLAVNHWQTAIDTHRLNHPHTIHLCESLDADTDN